MTSELILVPCLETHVLAPFQSQHLSEPFPEAPFSTVLLVTHGLCSVHWESQGLEQHRPASRELAQEGFDARLSLCSSCAPQGLFLLRCRWPCAHGVHRHKHVTGHTSLRLVPLQSI